MKRKGSAAWQGGLKDGKGTVSTGSGVLSNVSYSFSKRFEEEKGTNPEELIAAAHASCFAMATSAQLDGAGIKAQNIAATATVTLEKVGDGFSVTASHLDVNQGSGSGSRKSANGSGQREGRLPDFKAVECENFDGGKDRSLGKISATLSPLRGFDLMTKLHPGLTPWARVFPPLRD